MMFDTFFANEDIPHIPVIDKMQFLLDEDWRFKVVHGGRGGGKSEGISDALLAKCLREKHLILCTREYQTSIADSVHRTLRHSIEKLGLEKWFVVQEKSIKCPCTGSEFIFKGLHHSISEIKSTHGITICWVEEAQAVSKESWQVLVPTIRGKVGAEIWVSFNPYLEEDPTSQMFLEHPDHRMKVVEINWDDNPWFPPDMEVDRLALLEQDPHAYEHVYNGKYLALPEAAIFKGSYEVRAFNTPEDARFFYGIDFGFANDPNFATRCFQQDGYLYVDYEAYGLKTEIDDIPALLEGGISKKTGAVFLGIPGVRDWPIKADAARPETISYLRRRGFSVKAAEKWKGSVEDGIAHLKGFKKIIVHSRCPRLAQEMRLYSYKRDKQTDDILPKIDDKHNHGIDSLRYALDGYIQQRGASGIWKRIGQKASGMPMEPL